MNYRLKMAIPGWKKEVDINSIYVDWNSDPQGELGVVTDCGCFMVMRNKISALSREPLFVPKIEQLGECHYLTRKVL